MQFSEYNIDGNKQLLSWLQSMPSESLNKLRMINESTGSARHVILTLAFAICDSNIRSLSRMITGLLVKRMQAERAGSMLQVEKIDQYMRHMHESIDFVTGVSVATNGSRHSCNRAKRRRTEGGLKTAS